MIRIKLLYVSLIYFFLFRPGLQDVNDFDIILRLKFGRFNR